MKKHISKSSNGETYLNLETNEEIISSVVILIAVLSDQHTRNYKNQMRFFLLHLQCILQATQEMVAKHLYALFLAYLLILFLFASKHVT